MHEHTYLEHLTNLWMSESSSKLVRICKQSYGPCKNQHYSEYVLIFITIDWNMANTNSSVVRKICVWMSASTTVENLRYVDEESDTAVWSREQCSMPLVYCYLAAYITHVSLC